MREEKQTREAEKEAHKLKVSLHSAFFFNTRPRVSLRSSSETILLFFPIFSTPPSAQVGLELLKREQALERAELAAMSAHDAASSLAFKKGRDPPVEDKAAVAEAAEDAEEEDFLRKSQSRGRRR